MDKKQITKTELEKLYRSSKNTDLAEQLGISVPTLIRYVSEAGIELKQKGNHDNSDKKKFAIA